MRTGTFRQRNIIVTQRVLILIFERCQLTENQKKKGQAKGTATPLSWAYFSYWAIKSILLITFTNYKNASTGISLDQPVLLGIPNQSPSFWFPL